MSKQLVDGIWVIVCDWQDPNTGNPCALGNEGEPAMFIDPTGGKDETNHFQCGRHHGIVPQEEQEEFQVPDDHKLNQDVMRPGRRMAGIEVEEVEDD